MISPGRTEVILLSLLRAGMKLIDAVQKPARNTQSNEAALRKAA